MEKTNWIGITFLAQQVSYIAIPMADAACKRTKCI
jgi:hypothetical protein